MVLNQYARGVRLWSRTTSGTWYQTDLAQAVAMDTELRNLLLHHIAFDRHHRQELEVLSILIWLVSSSLVLPV